MTFKEPKTKPVKAARFTVLLRDIDAMSIATVYEGLKEKLQIDVKRVGNSRLRRLILEAPEDQRLAGWIYAVAKEEHGRAELHFDRKMGQWIGKARARIAGMKDDGEWHGTVTQADVERIIASDFTEDYQPAKEKLLQAAKIERAARTLYQVFESRLSSLQTYSRLIDRKREISRREFNEPAKQQRGD